MNTPQTRFIALTAKKATNTEHTVINGNQSKCRISPFWMGGYSTDRVIPRTSVSMFVSKRG